MRALFFNIKGAGHVNPTLPIARALVERGHDVVFTVTPEWRERLASIGCRYENTAGAPDAPFTVAHYHPTAPFPLQILPAAAAVLPDLVARAEKYRPEVVIYDSFAAWGRVVAEVVGARQICSLSTLVGEHEESGYPLDAANLEALDTIANRWKVDLRGDQLGAYFAKRGHNIVHSCRSLNASPEERGNDPATFEFVGPLVDASSDSDSELRAAGLDAYAANDGRKRVYVSMGTVAAAPKDFFATFVEAFGGRQDLEVLMSVGKHLDIAELGTLPPNVTARNRVPQHGVLAHTDVFVSHAGANSMHESLFFGVPLVCIPHFADQPTNARTVAAAGAGVNLPLPELSAERLRSDVERVLGDDRYREAAQRLKSELRACGGLDAVMRLVEGR